MWLWALLPICLAVFGTVGIWTAKVAERHNFLNTVTVLAGTGFHSGAAVCEWALVVLFFCLFSLFVAEFRHINCHLTVREQATGNDSSSTSTEINGHVANALS
ncbi:modulator of macroautophagy TMEM150B [Etheostoma cragini]|uniref:modulator of macroautophagy TMEM150B n=1 Tax=Etheostoma cragini TaxID=417921 RepID=UPI00155EB1D3|nr:modulator of macroautophagy TMEM150B [Etheostoma cragini]